MNFNYDKTETIRGYIYFYANERIIAVFNPLVGLCVRH